MYAEPSNLNLCKKANICLFLNVKYFFKTIILVLDKSYSCVFIYLMCTVTIVLVVLIYCKISEKGIDYLVCVD